MDSSSFLATIVFIGAPAVRAIEVGVSVTEDLVLGGDIHVAMDAPTL